MNVKTPEGAVPSGAFCTAFNYVLDGIISFELTIQQNPLDRAEIAPQAGQQPFTGQLAKLMGGT